MKRQGEFLARHIAKFSEIIRDLNMPDPLPVDGVAAAAQGGHCGLLSGPKLLPTRSPQTAQRPCPGRPSRITDCATSDLNKPNPLPVDGMAPLPWPAFAGS